MVIAETLPIDVDHQQIRLIPAAFPQLAQLFSAAFDCLATDAATRDAGRLSHLGQNFLVLTRRNSTQQRSHHALRGGSVLLQRFIRRYFHFAFLPMTKPRPLHFQLAVGERHLTILRTVPADIPLIFPGVCSPATCSALSVRIVSMVLRPIELITSSTATLA